MKKSTVVVLTGTNLDSMVTAAEIMGSRGKAVTIKLSAGTYEFKRSLPSGLNIHGSTAGKYTLIGWGV